MSACCDFFDALDYCLAGDVQEAARQVGAVAYGSQIGADETSE